MPEQEARTEAEQEALLANEGFYRALGNSDMGAMEQVWARLTPVTCLHPGWTLLSGREEVLESWRTILSNPNQPRIVGGRRERHGDRQHGRRPLPRGRLG